MKKFLSLLLAAMMIFSVLPTAALADGMKTLDMAPVGEAAAPAGEPASEAEQPEEVAVQAAGDDLAVTFKGISKKLAKMEVYAYQNGQVGAEKLLEITKNSTTVNLPAGDYWIKGYDSKNNYSGGIKMTVNPDETNTIWLHIVYQIKPQNTGWVEGEDYIVSIAVKDASGITTYSTEMGKYDSGSTITPSCLVPHKGTFNATYAPTQKRSDEGYVEVTVTKGNVIADFAAPTNGAQIVMGRELKVHAPLGSTISAGYLKHSYYYLFAKSTVETRSDEVVATFVGIPENLPVFVRVQHPDGVTYWNFADIRNDMALKQGLCGKMNEDGEVVITAEDLAIGDTSFNKSTIYRFEKNGVDRGDIYLNINAQGYKSMTVGETFGLNVFRNWQAIEGFANAYIALPDMHYQVIDANGNPSDVVSVIPDADNSSAATLVANKQGTAIVLVTYDAMLHSQGSGAKGGRGEFTAIWPECTGVFIVTVDADGTGIQTNMTMDRMDADAAEGYDKIDAEHDFLFYLGDKGAEYSFKPESGCTVTVARSTVTDKMTFNGFTAEGVSVAEDGTVTVARSTVTDKMTFNGFTAEGVSVAEDGTVTVSGLTTGRHIIKVEKNGVANYQVVTARGVTLKLLDEEKNELPMDTRFNPGDKVTLQFWELLNPQEKLATVYNFNFCLHLQGSDGTYFDSSNGGDYGVYNFSSSLALQRITITIPEDWDGTTYSLAGALSKGGFAGHNTHREIVYGIGRAPVFDAASASGVLTRMPEVTLNVLNKDVKNVEDLIAAIGTVTKDSGEAIKAARDAYNALTTEQKALVSKEAYDALVKAEKLFDMIQSSNKPGTLPGGKTDSSSSGVIKISATGAAKGEQNPNTGAPAMSMAPAVLVLAAAALVLKKRG